jgi:Tfp pilus assembly protein PilE
MKHLKGFTIVEALMLLGVVVLLAGVGYVGWKAFTKSDDTQATLISPETSAEVITTKDDLEAAEKALEELNFEDSAAAEAESKATL